MEHFWKKIPSKPLDFPSFRFLVVSNTSSQRESETETERQRERELHLSSNVFADKGARQQKDIYPGGRSSSGDLVAVQTSAAWCRQLQRCPRSHQRRGTNNQETEQEERSNFTYQIPSLKKKAQVEVMCLPPTNRTIYIHTSRQHKVNEHVGIFQGYGVGKGGMWFGGGEENIFSFGISGDSSVVRAPDS